MKRKILFILLFIIISITSFAQDVHIYMGNNNSYESIIATFDGVCIYGGYEKSKSNIIGYVIDNKMYDKKGVLLFVWENNKLYVGSSDDENNVLYTLNMNKIYIGTKIKNKYCMYIFGHTNSCLYDDIKRRVHMRWDGNMDANIFLFVVNYYM